MKETFKGVDRRLLIPFEEKPKKPQDQERENGDYGFNDTESIADGDDHSQSEDTEGGRAKGKSRLELVDGVAKKIRREANDLEVSGEKTKMFKDGVKEIVKEAFLRSKELSRIQDETEYTVLPLVDQQPRETEYEVPAGDMSDYVRLVNSVRKEKSVIQRKLYDIVLDKQYARWIPGADKGKRIDKKRLARIPFGERNIFKYKVESDMRDVAFILVVDESGSMCGEKARQARRCAIMFGEILDALGVPFAIVGFTTCGLNEKQKAKAHLSRHSGSYNRAENLRHNIFKRFGEAYARIKTRLVNISAYQCNYDQDTLEYAWNMLLSYCIQNAITEKVMIVISDGQPCGGVEARKKLKRVINEIGCDPNAEVVGIGIRTNYVKDFYHKCVEIDDISQLGINVVRLIASVFLRKLRKGKAIKAVQ